MDNEEIRATDRVIREQLIPTMDDESSYLPEETINSSILKRQK